MENRILTVSHDLSETLTVSFDGSGYIVKSITQRATGGTFPENRYYSGTPLDRLEVFGVVEA